MKISDVIKDLQEGNKETFSKYVSERSVKIVREQIHGKIPVEIEEETEEEQNEGK